MEKMLKAKQQAKKQLFGDLRMYGIATGIILVIFMIGQITNLGNFRDIFSASGTSELENWIAVILAALFAGYIICSIGVGFKFLALLLSEKISSVLLRGLIILFCCEIVGMILLPLRIISNTVCLIIANKNLKKNS